MTREEAREELITFIGTFECPSLEAVEMAIEALQTDIAKAYNQGFVEGSVNATVNSNYICPRCGEKMEQYKSTKAEPSEDGTLEVKVEDTTKVGRVLISDDKHRGGLYYPDEDEPQQEVPKIIVHVDRPKGHWIDMPYTPSHTKYMCSECGKVMYTNSEYIKEQNFCFSCGAYMEGEDK